MNTDRKSMVHLLTGLLRVSVAVGLVLALTFNTVAATSPNPLDDGGWVLVAHMSNSGGMFDGNGELSSTYNYGAFVANPVPSTPDFQRAFPIVADKILFITGDLSVWGIADYGALRTLIDARGNVQAPNLAFEIGVNGVISNTTGNVLSRAANPEDPWISIDGSHTAGITNQRIVWGENNYGAGTHQALKNSHGGINVYVRAARTVTFGANSGSGTMVPQVSSVPAALTLSTFTRAGYTFAGWNTAANGTGTAYADGATYSFAADITLYAQWTQVVVPGSGGGNGPGGVGITDGSSALELWLNADKGAFTDATCSTGAGNGSNVGCWKDQSGNTIDFTQGTSDQEPNLQTAVLNNQSVVRFNGSTDWMQYPNFSPLTNAPGYTVFILGAASAANQTFLGGTNSSDGHGLLAEASGTNNFRFVHRMPFGSAGGDNLITAGGNFTFGASNLVSLRRSATSQEIYLQGASAASMVPTAAAYNQNLNLALGRLGTGLAQRYLNGDVGQVIIFSSSLPDVDRILVENYLSAKYGVALSANDVYDGDANDANHNFDLDMAGIGRFGGNNHTQAHSVGLIVRNRTFLQDNGDWLTFGHRTTSNNKVATDLPTGGGWGTDSRRWERHWYFNRTDANANGGTVDIIFDFSEGNMNGGQPPAGPAGNYRLLRRADGVSQFSDIATATAVVGDQVQFLGVDVNLLGSNFTLGTLNDTTSPTAIGLQSLAAMPIDQPPLLQIGLGAFLLILAGGVLVINRRQHRSQP